MTATELIAKFELYVDDSTELSTAEELALCNKIYHKICDDRPWEFLKTEASGTMASTTTITLPTNFAYFVENRSWTDNSEDSNAVAKPTGILINGTTWLQLINWSDRRQYVNTDGYAYVDLGASLIRTTYAQPASATYSFDYKSVPTDLVGGASPTSPVFPARFHDMIYHGMAVDDMIIQLFEKARSYAAENQAQYNSYLQRLCAWNANLQNM